MQRCCLLPIFMEVNLVRKNSLLKNLSVNSLLAAFYGQFLESVPVNNLWYETRVRQIRDKWCLKLKKVGGSDTSSYK